MFITALWRKVGRCDASLHECVETVVAVAMLAAEVDKLLLWNGLCASKTFAMLSLLREALCNPSSELARSLLLSLRESDHYDAVN
jgi:hypothetical protein